MKSKIQTLTYIILIFIFLDSCDSFRDTEIYDYQEIPKSLDGVWQLKTVSRNGIDITKAMDFSQFKLNLKNDGSYTMENYLPFAVKKEGKWRIDDPQYPFNLFFLEQESTEEVGVSLKYPIIEGKRIISIDLSPGCDRNSYQYVFEKIDNN